MAIPTILSATIDGSTLVVVFSEAVGNQSSVGIGYGISLVINGTPTDVLFSGGDNTDTGTYTSLTAAMGGDVVTLNYDSIAGLYSVSTSDTLADVTGFAVTNITAGSVIACDTGSFILTGIDARILAPLHAMCDSGTFLLAGSPTASRLTRKMIAESGAFSLVGFTQGEGYARAIVGATGEFSLDGGSGRLVGPSQSITADVGAFMLTGGDSSVVDGSPFICETGILTVTGSAMNQSFAQPVAVGSFELAGSAAGELIQPYFAAESGSFAIVGVDASLNVQQFGAAKHIYNHFFIRS